MKNLLYILLVSLVSLTSVIAQDEIEINLRVLPPYSLKLEYYANYENVVIDIRNTTNVNQSLKFKALLFNDNGLSAETDFNNTLEPFDLGPNEVRMLTGDQIVDLGLNLDQSDFDLSGLPLGTIDYIEQTRQLPEGNYTLCVQAFDFDTEQMLSKNAPDGCDNWVLVQPERPLIQIPVDGSEVIANETDNVSFFWNPVNSGILDPTMIEYDLRVVDLEDFNGQPTLLTILDQAYDYVLYERGLNINQYSSNNGDNNEVIDLIEGRRYAVLVTAIDPNNELPEQFQNHSDVITFVYVQEGEDEFGQATPPEIRYPEQDDNQESTDIFQWEMPTNLNGNVLTDVRTTLSFIDLNEHNDGNELNLAEYRSLAGTGVDMSVGLEGNFAVWMEESTGDHIETSTRPPSFVRGHKYAMVVKCAFQNGYLVENDGYSQIVHFTYGDPDPTESEGNIRTLTFGVGPQVTYDEGDVVLLDDGGSGGGSESNSEDQESSCEDNCTYTLPPAETSPATGSMADILSANNDIFKLGKFDITVLESNEGGSSLSGKGIVKVNLGVEVNVNVNFTNIKLNSNGRAVSGSAAAANDVPQFDIDKFGGKLAENAPSLNDLLNGVSGASSLAGEVRLISQLISGKPIGMPLGIDSQIDGYKVLLGVTSMKFEVTRASCTIAAEFHVPPELIKGGNGRFGLKASDVCIIPSGFGKEFVLSLSDDLNIPIDNNEFLSVKGSKGSTDKQDIIDKATYIEVDCHGLKGVALRFEIAFPKEFLILDERLLASGDPKDGIVHGKFGLSYRRGSSTNTVNNSENTSVDPGSNMNFIIDFDMDPFQISGLDGWGFTLEEGHIDLSTLDNPDGIEFPSGYDFGPAGSLTDTWQGFYLKKISVKVPDDFVKDEKNIESKLQVGLQKIIYDGQFSAEIFAKDIIEIHDGAMNGWAVSVDEFNVKFVQNSFIGGSLGGKFRLPVQDKDGHVAYSALLGETAPDANNNTKWGFVLNVEVIEEPIILPLFVADASIKEGSYIHLATEKIAIDPRKDEGQSFFLAGKLDIGGEAAKDLEAVLEMPGINYAIKYTQANGWDTDATKIGFASPQKYMGPATDPKGQEGGMSGFPITIENFKVTNGVIDPESEIKGTFTFDVKINFMDTDDGGLSADASMSFEAGWNTENSTFILDNFGVSCIGVDAEIGGVTLDGRVCFYNGTPPGCTQAPPSEGVKGIIKVGLPVAEINLAAEFGVASPVGEDPYRYWFVDGKVIISEGISMGTLSLYGISGGVYYNMALEENNVTKNGIDVDPGLLNDAKAMAGGDDNTLPDQDPNLDDETYKAQLANTTIEGSGQTFCPAKDKMTFKAGLVLGMAGDPSIFNMDVGVSASVEAGQGLTSFNITGSGYVMADFNERQNAYVIADIEIGYQKVVNEYEEYFADLEIFLKMKFEDFVQVTGDRGSKKTLGDIDSYSFLEANFKMKFLDGNPDPLWYFKMGEPKKRANGTGGPGAVAVKIGGSGSDQSDENKANGSVGVSVDIKSKFYLMAGNHDITPEFMDLPTLISEMLANPLTGDGDNGLVGGNVDSAESGRESPDDMMAAIMGSGTTSGFGMGFNLEVDLSVDFFLIYASLQAAAGFDLSITKPKGGLKCSVTKPDGTREITPMDGGGANGFYTKGRICAGIKGALGVQLDIAGEKRQFEIFTLGAAFVIEGGFPKPTWLQGTAVVMYSVMNGAMASTARFEFRAGDVCIPPETDPFKIKMIEEILPDGTDDHSLSIVPKVRFAEPVNIVQSYPITEQIEHSDGTLEVRDGYWYLAPYVHSIAIEDMDGNELSSVKIDPPDDPVEGNNDFGTSTARDASYSLSGGGTVLNYFNEAELEESTEYRIVVEVRAMESVEGQKKMLPVMIDNGEFWVEEESTTFTTGVLPLQIPYENMLSMNPMPLQKYFLKDERNKGHIYLKNYNNVAKRYLTKAGLEDRGWPRPEKIIARFTNVNTEQAHETDITEASKVYLKDNYKGTGQFGYNGSEGAGKPCGVSYFNLPTELINSQAYKLEF